MFAASAFGEIPFAGFAGIQVVEPEPSGTSLRIRKSSKRPDFTRGKRRESTP